MEIEISLDTKWRAGEGAGHVLTPGWDASYTALVPRAARGLSMHPERMLIAAISSCYGMTLSRVLAAVGLPCTSIDVHADGVAEVSSDKLPLLRVTVSPTLHGADCARSDAYRKASVTARNDCAMGRSIRGNIAYLLGPVSVLADDA